MMISEVSKRMNISVDTLRYYEKLELYLKLDAMLMVFGIIAKMI